MLFVLIFAVSITSPVPVVYPVPGFVIVNVLSSPLLFSVAVAVATLVPVVGLFIVIVGTLKYLCFAFINSILDIVPVVSCGNARDIS